MTGCSVTNAPSYPPLYTLLSTGLAGSITTFSSWMLGGYLSFANLEGYNRGGLQNVSRVSSGRSWRLK